MHIDFSRHTGLYLGLYEMELNRALRRLVRPGRPCLDVGGAYGYDALVLAKLCRADVVSFEADPELCEIIRVNAAANAELGTLISVECGFVGDGPGEIALDDYVDLAPGFVKIDIEGAEAAALRAGRELFTRVRPTAIVETHSALLEDECAWLLDKMGYRTTIVNPRRWLVELRPAEHNRWLLAEPR
jgi:hypothetical protein